MVKKLFFSIVSLILFSILGNFTLWAKNITNKDNIFDKLKNTLSQEVIALDKLIQENKIKFETKKAELKKIEDKILSGSQKHTTDEINAISSQIELKKNFLAEKQLLLEKTKKELETEEKNLKEKITSLPLEKQLTLKKFFKQKKTKKLELAQLEIDSAKMELAHLKKLYQTYKKNEVVTPKEIKKTAEITKQINIQLTKKKEETKKALLVTKAKEKEAEKIKNKAIKAIEKAKSKQEKEYALLLKELADEKLTESESEKNYLSLEQKKTESELEKAKIQLKILTAIAKFQNKKVGILEKLKLKKELLEIKENINKDLEYLHKSLENNTKIIASLEKKLKTYLEKKKKAKNYKISRAIKNIIYTIKKNQSYRKKINSLILEIITLKEDTLSLVKDFIKNSLSSNQSKPLFYKIQTNYNLDEITLFLSFYREKIFNSFPQLKSFWLDFKIYLSKFNLKKINFSIVIAIFIILIAIIIRKIISLKLKKYLLETQTLHQRIEEENGNNFFDFFLTATKKSIPFLIYTLTLWILAYLFQLQWKLKEIFLFLYFSIFCFYLIKTSIYYYLENHYLTSEEKNYLSRLKFLWKTFLLISLYYSNLTFTYTLLTSRTVKTIHLIYGVFLVFILSILLKNIFTKIIPDKRSLVLRILKKFIIKFYPLLLTFLLGLFTIYAFGYRNLVYFIVNGIIFTILIFYVKSILYHRLDAKFNQLKEKYQEKITISSLLNSAQKITYFLLNALSWILLYFLWGGNKELLAKIYYFSSLAIKFGTVEISLINILKFSLVIYLSFKLSHLIQFIFDQRVAIYFSWDQGILNSILTVLHYLIILFGFIIALDTLGIGLEGLKWMTGFIGIGLGFGLQNIVNNFISGIILLFERPVKVGDIIKIEDDILGKVKKISVRSTIVETFDNIEIIVPNSDLISNKVINYTLSSPTVRRHIKIGVSYNADPIKVADILIKIAKKHKNVFNFPPPKVYFTNYGDSSLDFDLIYWTSFSNGYDTDTQLRFQIFQELSKNNIEIPYPQRDIYIKEFPANLIVKEEKNQKPKTKEEEDLES